MQLKFLSEKVAAEDLREFAKHWYPDFLKGCVDLENRKVVVGGDYHMETCEFLTRLGGRHKNIWGFNLRYLDNGKIALEFDSLVNIKPLLNKSRVVQNEELQQEIARLVKEFIIF